MTKDQIKLIEQILSQPQPIPQPQQKIQSKPKRNLEGSPIFWFMFGWLFAAIMVALEFILVLRGNL